jgi:drug/metabolite transporter (DMT)-like permease
VQYVWIAIIVASGLPLLFIGWLMNPLSLLINGIQWWRDSIERLHPHRWWIVFLILVFAFSVAVYTLHYT